MKPHSIYCLILFGLMPVVSMAAAFQEDFQAYPPGVLPEETGGSPWLARPEGKTNDDGGVVITRIESDRGNLFAQGADNHYLRLSRSSGNGDTQNVAVNGLAHSPTIILTLDFLLPSADAPGGMGYVLRVGNAAGNANTAFAICLNDGALWPTSGTGVNPTKTPLASISLGTVHHLTLVMNNSKEPVVYGPQRSQLSAGQMDVWLDGECAGSGLAKSGGADGSGIKTGVRLDSFSITAKVHTHGSLWVDNISCDSLL
ncbi:MAG: hypothetical protein Q7Q73_19090 [Verrucomicrobiota bacterium JB024]|nr:hypothetical protein [Verrucomicrobiota bacterium JB024]